MTREFLSSYPTIIDETVIYLQQVRKRSAHNKQSLENGNFKLLLFNAMDS
jgi:hypothetical protein